MIINNKKITNEKIQVVQADGHSLDPIGTVELNINLGKKQFKYTQSCITRIFKCGTFDSR